MICLDQELVEKLKGENVSALVNRLLKEHLSSTLVEQMSKGEQKLAVMEFDLGQKHKKEMQKLYDNARRKK